MYEMDIIRIIWEFLSASPEGVDLAVIPLAIPLIMAGIGAATKVGAGIRGGKQMDAYQSSLDKQKAGMDAWYNTEKNRDFMESDIASAAMNKVLENIQDQNKVAESAAAVTGGSDASVLAAKSKSQEQFGNVVKDLAGYGTQRRDRVESIHRQDLLNMFGLERDLHKGRATNAATLGSVGGDLMGAAGTMFGETKWGSAGTDAFGGDGEVMAGEDTSGELLA